MTLTLLSDTPEVGRIIDKIVDEVVPVWSMLGNKCKREMVRGIRTACTVLRHSAACSGYHSHAASFRNPILGGTARCWARIGGKGSRDVLAARNQT